MRSRASGALRVQPLALVRHRPATAPPPPRHRHTANLSRLPLGLSTMTDHDDELHALLQEAETVYEEYDQGYLDADAALRRLRPLVEDLDTAVED